MSYVIRRHSVDLNGDKYSPRTLATHHNLPTARATYFRTITAALERSAPWRVNDELEQKRADHVTFTIYDKRGHQFVYTLRKG